MELFRGSGKKTGIFRSAEAAYAVDSLCSNYLAAESSNEPLLLTGFFLMMFLSVRPFEAGTVRIGLLTAMWLLNRKGYSVSRFVSVERTIEANMRLFRLEFVEVGNDEQINAIHKSSWLKFWLETLLMSYRELEARAAALSGRRGAKTDMVLALINSINGDFSIRQIQQQIPECGIEMIRKILKEQKAAGKIRCIGRGPNAQWRRKRSRSPVIV